jgi:hypothetical protein
MEPVDYNMIMNGRVDTVDVGVETSDDSASYDPVSTRSSTESPIKNEKITGPNKVLLVLDQRTGTHCED